MASRGLSTHVGKYRDSNVIIPLTIKVFVFIICEPGMNCMLLLNIFD